VRPLRASLSRRAMLIPVALLLIAGALVWPIAGTLARPGVSGQWHLLFQLQQTFSILRILFFLALVGLSQLLGIGWRDRELQIVTGLGLYSLVSLGAAAMHSHSESPNLYRAVNQIVMGSYLSSLIYWVFSFVQNEAPRQEFSPRMQSILLSVAGSARASRMAMDDVRKLKP
jgi:prepilin signal peptidase PulO-like enzyme (type II secretory pathway)